MLTAPGKRRIVGGGEVEAPHPEQGVQEPFGLAQLEMVEESQGQGGLDGKIRVPPRPAPSAAPAERPGSARFPRTTTPSHPGVGARMRAGLRASHRRDCHLPMRYETGLPSSVIRFRTLHASTASRRCPDELRARRQSPTIDVYRKNAFSTRAC